MTLQVRIDQDLCMSSGKCVADEPEAFGFDEEELSVVLPGATSLSEERLRRAARMCPGQAIILIGEAGEPIEFG